MNQEPRTNFTKTKLIHIGEKVKVYEGSHASFGRQVVIKELNREADATFRKEFFDEAKRWGKFEHARLARIEEVNEDRGWIVTEYLPEALNQRIGESLDLGELKQATLQILEGLKQLHSLGRLHCNLNSSNIRYSGDDVKLTDGRGVSLSRAAQLPRPKGSNKFRAPEMLDNKFGPVGMATDLYLAASVILEAIAGSRFDSFFQGHIEGTPDPETGWIRWHNSELQLDPIKDLVPNIPDAYARLLDGMLSKFVKSRIGSAEDAINDLNKIEMIGVLGAAASSPAATPKPTPPSPVKRDVFQPQLISRPKTPAYLRIASGVKAGALFPVQLQDVVIGEGPNCHVKLSGNDYVKVRGREVSIVLGTGGWRVSETKRPEDCKETLYVGHQPCESNLPVRSGDIIRLSDSGPDLQFVIQGESTWEWQDVAVELKLSKSADHQQNAAPRPQTRSAKPGGARRQPNDSAAPTARRRPKPPQPSGSAPVPPKGAAAPAGNSAEPARPNNHAAPAPPKERKNQRSKDGGGNAVGANLSEWLNDKDKRNWLVLIGGLLGVAIIVPLLLGGSGEKDETEKPKTEVTQPLENETDEAELESVSVDAEQENNSDVSETGKEEDQSSGGLQEEIEGQSEVDEK